MLIAATTVARSNTYNTLCEKHSAEQQYLSAEMMSVDTLSLQAIKDNGYRMLVNNVVDQSPFMTLEAKTCRPFTCDACCDNKGKNAYCACAD